MPTGVEGSYFPVGNLKNRSRLGSLLPPGCIHVPKCDLKKQIPHVKIPLELLYTFK